MINDNVIEFTKHASDGSMFQRCLELHAKECAIHLLNTYPISDICIADTGFDSDVFDLAKCKMMFIDINSRNDIGKTILHVALAQEVIDKDFIYRLLDEGADIDVVDFDGVTPRMLLEEKKIPIGSSCIIL